MVNPTDKQSFLRGPIEGSLRTRLEALTQRQQELENLISDPEVQKERARFQEILKEHGASQALAGLYQRYHKVETELHEVRQLAEGDDPELKELAIAELEPLEENLAQAAAQIREHLLDQEEEGADDCFVEIRAGAGGGEAALFAANIYRMYSLYAERRRWKIEVMHESCTDLGGYKEIIFSVRGKGAYHRLRFESGGHRVQRVPETEAQGRIHTSAITVAVFEEAEESEIEIHDADLRIDTFYASGPGGQKVNKTASAVRLTHIPTGIVVSIQDEKSQHKNRAKALRVLRSRLREKEENERREKESKLRRTLIGSGDRSDRIRTYNFPQNRVTDHRINATLYSLDRLILGELDELLDSLETHDREERVQGLEG